MDWEGILGEDWDGGEHCIAPQGEGEGTKSGKGMEVVDNKGSEGTVHPGDFWMG